MLAPMLVPAVYRENLAASAGPGTPAQPVPRPQKLCQGVQADDPPIHVQGQEAGCTGGKAASTGHKKEQKNEGPVLQQPWKLIDKR